ncbi:unnamed protein product [Paramecium primaurelia]|uniref:Uncharacterized protein n=1 Tax=Paramecium primaurelia TaxID=5886 RepID=A0A8S1PDC6_PARPR|nr:unnamed protein product [Paramecium primaurelia]
MNQKITIQKLIILSLLNTFTKYHKIDINIQLLTQIINIKCLFHKIKQFLMKEQLNYQINKLQLQLQKQIGQLNIFQVSNSLGFLDNKDEDINEPIPILPK